MEIMENTWDYYEVEDAPFRDEPKEEVDETEE